ncbi:MAG: HlyD family efflux transporter periplasmic adaptor subunit [Kiritimatiellia bacterium]|nr:HlyD family efflux transporter periplasmic adaptor subunit [Kiritimatiellia bacterium]MDD4173035.1 HlyD family efflux transporter periplasmic adaptor subunit [Kiritimatiellia bacterium]MDD4441234.1 HlyD family efflux transporter periplasmic adaptor subunit [Kiritimatiellia bacterium]MDX9792056.1 HlyD family efflux transporter periplasmic adaptor subunit [Kiritimatiellia bacterium]NLC80617.1 HlyD family efflux transporter periplasmic adaptor subunit [Lentisphaerota bacterium]
MVKKHSKKKLIIGALVAVLAVTAWLLTRKGGTAGEQVPVFAVQRGPLTIAVTSGGSIQSRDKVVISSELEGNNTVIWVITEGVNVQPGDLLLEFDASDLVEKRNEQEIAVANAEANLIIAEEKLGITEGDCEAALLDREVDQMLAKMALEKYQKGDYPQQVRQYDADIALADEELKRAVEKLEWSERLAKEGFLTRTELQADELALQRKQLDLEMSMTKINVLTNYTVLQQRSTLESSRRRAERALARVKWQNKASLRQVETEVNARTRERDRATNRLEELNFQISKSKIYAPTNGMILYASTVQIASRKWWIKPLEVGSMAVERQELIYIPLESGMVVEVMIPEASLNKIDTGMPARVKVDAFPGRVFDGRLVKIGILPDGQSAQLNPDLKLYKCEIECDFKDVTIRPGMSCDVELIKEAYEDALYVPVQCVVRVEGVPRVYVNDDGEWVPRIVRVGLDNNRMIHVLEGVRAGEEVMLAPPVKEQKQEEVKEIERPKEPPRGNGARPDGGTPRKPKTAAAKPAAGRVREPGARKTPPGGGARQG